MSGLVNLGRKEHPSALHGSLVQPVFSGDFLVLLNQRAGARADSHDQGQVL